MARMWLVLAAANGFLAVALGAFGAHGLKRMLEAAPDGALRLQWWQTAAHYHLAHALALGLLAAAAPHLSGRLPQASGWFLLAGIVLFCGSLYTMTLTGVRALGAITPVGGVCLLAGWLSLAVAAVKLR